MTLAQYAFDYEGFTFGVGTDYGVIKIGGMASGDFKTTEVVNPGGDGSWFTSLYRAAKRPMFMLDYHGDAPFTDIMETLETALAPQVDEKELHFNLPDVLGGSDRLKYINCRPISVSYDITPMFSIGYVS